MNAGLDDHFYSLRRNIALSDARRKHKEGAGLSQDVRRARGLELTPEEEKFLARQVHMNDGNRVSVGAGVDDHFYSLRRDIAVRAAWGKQKDGAGLSQDDRRARGLELTLEEEKLLVRQVNMLCVCTQMMVIVYVWV